MFSLALISVKMKKQRDRISVAGRIPEFQTIVECPKFSCFLKKDLEKKLKISKTIAEIPKA